MDRRNTFPAPASNGNAGVAPSSFVRGFRRPKRESQSPVPSITYGEKSGSARPAAWIAVFTALARGFVEEVVYLSRGLCTDARHFGEIGWRRALDGLEGSEMVKQRTLAGRADPRDLL